MTERRVESRSVGPSLARVDTLRFVNEAMSLLSGTDEASWPVLESSTVTEGGEWENKNVRSIARFGDELGGLLSARARAASPTKRHLHARWCSRHDVRVPWSRTDAPALDAHHREHFPGGRLPRRRRPSRSREGDAGDPSPRRRRSRELGRARRGRAQEDPGRERPPSRVRLSRRIRRACGAWIQRGPRAASSFSSSAMRSSARLRAAASVALASASVPSASRAMRSPT